MFTLVTVRTLRCPPYRGIFLKCFRPFVASWPAPSASGRSESGRVGISPTGLVHLRQGTHNVFIERLWKSVKYQEIYLRDYATVADVEEGLRLWFEKYNHERPHQSLDNLTPAKVYEWGAAVRAKRRVERMA